MTWELAGWRPTLEASCLITDSRSGESIDDFTAIRPALSLLARCASRLDLGAALAWGCTPARLSSSGWRERRDLYPQGVGSGDPDDHSVILWTRRPYADGRDRATLQVEVADEAGAQHQKTKVTKRSWYYYLGQCASC